MTDGEYQVVLSYWFHFVRHNVDTDNVFNEIGRGTFGDVFEINESIFNDSLSDFENNLAFKFASMKKNVSLFVCIIKKILYVVYK